MAKRTKDLKPDIVLKNYWRNNVLLVEARQNRLALHNINNVDLFNLLEIVLNKEIPWNETREKAIEYAKEHHTDKTVVMAVAGATNCRIDYNILDEKGDADMCTVFEETRAEGRAEGKAEGRAEGKAEGRAEGKAEGRAEGRAEEIVVMGYEFGLSEHDILERLQKKLDVSFQKAQRYLEMFGKKTV